MLYFTVLGEPVIKMLRYQQQFSFYDDSKVGDVLRFINLSEAALKHDLGVVLQEIMAQVAAANPGVVVIDSFRSLARRATGEAGAHEAGEKVGGQLAADEIAEVLDPVDVGDGGSDENSSHCSAFRPVRRGF